MVLQTPGATAFFGGSQAGQECEVRYRVNGTLPWTTTPTTTLLAIVITGLTPATQYDIQAQCSNDEGPSGWSSSFTFTTLAAALTAPSFTDDTGDAQTWTVGFVIPRITVPEAEGNPVPTYAVEGVIPAGIAFNTTTRVISGSPDDIGSGTITIRATNSQGSADWTFDYSVSAAPAGPPIPTFKLEVDWGNDGTFSHANANVSNDVVASRGIYCERGRGGNGSILYDQSRAEC